ncbi:hypothetical protein DFH08DRAFT_948142 [Mycena albidolilacea]|uniref:Uncharacterized protein n=1 Tax=Mycena albidolilacea TaxID=1033008 RepID=A0AAD7AQE9_9AGAR|nr:hypothetical protein DFH08DRAFT_948142 [Mycena albidolilacea]
MALLLTLFTHLCVHLLGLMGNPVLTLILSAVALLTYWLHLVLSPAVWPGRILDDALTRIDVMKTRLHEEAARRRMLDMYNLSTYGIRGLEKHKRICNKLANDHHTYLNSPLYYPCVGLSLCKRARRCKRDVEAFCQELDVKIQRLDNQDAADDNEDAASRIRTRFNAVFTALFD